MVCPNCGAKYANSALNFCSACGTKLVAPQPPEVYDSCDLYSAWTDLEIGDPIGSGHGSTVYRATCADGSGFAAVKVVSVPADQAEVEALQARGMDDEHIQKHFLNAVRDYRKKLQQVQSLKGDPNIVGISGFRVTKTDDLHYTFYIRMELLTPFSAINFGATVKESAVIKLGVDLCSAMERYSKRQIVHGNIKPSNIFLDKQGSYKLGDFGSTVLHAGQSSGGDVCSDMYAIGMILYRLLNNNRSPFADAHTREQGEPLPAPCNASEQMALVLDQACAFDPSKRFASAAQMKDALLRAAKGTYAPAAPEKKPAPVKETTPEKTPAPAREAAPSKAPAKRSTPTFTEDSVGHGAFVQDYVPTTPSRSGGKGLKTVAVILLVVVLLGGLVLGGIALWNHFGDGISLETPSFLDGLFDNDSDSSRDNDDDRDEDRDTEDEEDEEDKEDVDRPVWGGEEAVEETVAPPEEIEAWIMPSCVGMHQEEAMAELSMTGCELVTEFAFSDTVEAGYVMEQSVAAGDELLSGSEVVLVISKGPDMAPEGYNQKVVVTANEGSSYGTLELYEWVNSQWVCTFSCDATVGKNGISTNYGEGKKRTPEGTFKLGIALSASDISNDTWPFQKVTTDTCVVDDSDSPYYNTIQSISDLPSGVGYDPIGKTLTTGDSSVVIYIEHNGDGLTSDGVEAGKGSVITICGRTTTLKATAGCVDISSSNMKTLLSMLDYNKNPHIVIEAV